MTSTCRRAIITLLSIVGLAAGSVVLADGPKVGAVPPEIKAAGYLNAKAGAPTLAALKGKVVVVAFWATWNPPSRKLLPQLEDLKEKFAASGLVIVGLSDEPKEKVEPFAAKAKATYAIGFGSASHAEYGVSGLPIAYVVGGDGKVVWSGFPSPIEPKFEEAIEAAIAAAGTGK